MACCYGSDRIRLRRLAVAQLQAQAYEREGGKVVEQAFLNLGCVMLLLLAPWQPCGKLKRRASQEKPKCCFQGGWPLKKSIFFKVLISRPPPRKKLWFSIGWLLRVRLSQTSATCCGTLTCTRVQERECGQVVRQSFPKPKLCASSACPLAPPYNNKSSLQASQEKSKFFFRGVGLLRGLSSYKFL